MSTFICPECGSNDIAGSDNEGGSAPGAMSCSSCEFFGLDDDFISVDDADTSGCAFTDGSNICPHCGEPNLCIDDGGGTICASCGWSADVDASQQDIDFRDSSYTPL